ncbi:hypothetical protein K491DRAFT_342024 [Lophiostoma macrostomum CBS 122681]|uniref:AB hydrolase-1 domain-containing protein n=1 Tax=Lophiostoma macrostomum CBS 122681 TaxID=1314788 RepID=A0A6A6TB86_9PLEO|nr:hypothetical protein K491DRAFT_342024 [Lophiostoma macrostomum CBS 122681]
MSYQSSEEDLPPFPTPEDSTITLDGKPTAKIHYTYYAPSPSSTHHPNPFAQTLIVYLNGLILPRASWTPSINSFLEKRITARLPYPALLTYDRYGQGTSDHDPSDPDPPPSHGHDCISAVHALHQLLLQLWASKSPPPSASTSQHHTPSISSSASSPQALPHLIFVANSIGCALARLFASAYPCTVSGLLFLDSIMANSDNVSIWPDPDAPDFDPHTLPPGVSVDDVRDTRSKYARVFHPDVPNSEGLSRRNLAALLPEADGPLLRGTSDPEGKGGDGPYLTIVGHDWAEFASQGLTGSLHTPKALTMTYMNPAWQSYNEGLVRITDEGRAIGPLIAVGCGHFVQRDGPGFVSDEVVSLLDRVVNRGEQLRER